MKGTEVNADTLAIDVIDEVGPDGHFLECDHTLQHFKNDWYPDLMDRHNYEDWVNAGSKSIVETSGEKVEKILNNESSWILPQEIQKKIRVIRERAEASAC
jgi:trimethylamine--corrinoid protein Co-methyltransferase